MKNDLQHRATVPAGDDPCHIRLSGIAKQDSFLGQADQRPVLDQALTLLAQQLAKHERHIASRFHAIREEAEKNIGEVTQVLQTTRGQLEKDLVPLSSVTPPAADVLRQLDDRLDHLVLRLSRRFRTQLQCALDPAAPEKQIMPAVMKALDKFRQEAAEALPEEFFLLHTRQAGTPFEPGRSVFELAVVPQLPRLCRSRLLARWRLFRLRRRLKRDYRLYPLPFREMATDALILRSNLAANALIERHEKTHEELKNRLIDHWRAIRYNLDNAVVDLEDMQEVAQAPRQSEPEDNLDRRGEIGPLVLAAFDQALESLGEIALALSTVQEGILAEIHEDHENALRIIRAGVEKSGSLRGRLRWGYKTLSKSVKRSLVETVERLSKGRARISGIFQRWQQQLQHFYLGVRRFFGLKADIAETQLRLTDLPLSSEVTDRARDLPPIYRRLYSTDPLVNREFLVAREEETVELQNALKRWMSQRPASVAIVGPEGSGKTSLLNCMENDLNTSVNVSHLSISQRPRTVPALCQTIARGLELSQPADSVDELIAQLQTISRRVIIVERAHHLMMRAVGGRQVTEAFFRLLMGTNDRILWIITLRLYPWKRMEYLFNARRYFTYVISCAFHDENELREALLRRER
ncbi:MAG: AAA family ATPase, partial [Gammaproteobacteria bacterium]|nr:AAA family ATPase [Gammaproteobacteria bacterium]